LPWQRGSVGKKGIGGIRWSISENFFYKRKNLAKISYTTRVIANFVPNFVAISTEVNREKCNWQHSMAHFQKPSYKRKNLAKISYTTRVIANFVPNFVGIATEIGQKKSNWQRPIAHPRNPFHLYRFRQKNLE